MIGTVDTLWRYPVKSMRGEQLDEVFIDDGGVRGDRLFAFRSSAAPASFPYFTAREQRQMLRYTPRVRRDGESGPRVEVETPAGDTLTIDDPALIEHLRSGAGESHHVTLMRSERPLTDAQPVSLISLQTVQRLADEISTPVDKRRFRANIYLDLPGNDAFAEDEFVGLSLRIGDDVVLSIVKRDTRCMMITVHPDTAAKTPALLKQVVQGHGGTAGVYGSVLRTGTVRQGDAVEFLD